MAIGKSSGGAFWLLRVGILSLSLAGGIAARRALVADEGQVVSEVTKQPPRPRRTVVAAEIPLPAPSQDSIESLLELRGLEFFGRLALWLVDADDEEIAELWEQYAQKNDREQWCVDLIFDHWTRVDPAAAMASAKSTGAERIAWWAWAGNDPSAAVAAAEAEEDFRFGEMVMRAIGQFHPEISNAMVEAHPEWMHWNAVEGVAYGIAKTDPQAAMDLATRFSPDAGSAILENWLRDDPSAAWRWIGENSMGESRDFYQAAVLQIERESPEQLKDLLTSAKPGKNKRLLEAALMRHLAKSDPEAALAMARGQTSTILKRDGLAAVGLATIEEDMAESLRLFNEMAAAEDDRDTNAKRFFTADGELMKIEPRTAAQIAFMNAMVASAPEAIMNEYFGGNEEMESMLSQAWASRDPAAYENYLERQVPGDAKDRGIARVGTEYLSRKEYAQAIETVQSANNPQQGSHIAAQAAAQWISVDPLGYETWWLDSSLSEEARTALPVPPRKSSDR